MRFVNQNQLSGGYSKKAGLAIVAIATCTLLLLVPALINQSHAYGRDAVWQVGLSENFNGPGSGQSGGGGFWGWLELDSSTGNYYAGDSADATFTGCGHDGSGSGLAGATHYNMDITGWYVAQSSQGPFMSFWASGGTVTLTGVLMNGTKLMHPVTITLAQAEADPIIGISADSGVPAQAGHYSSHTLFGTQAPPGQNFEIQVTQLSH